MNSVEKRLGATVSAVQTGLSISNRWILRRRVFLSIPSSRAVAYLSPPVAAQGGLNGTLFDFFERQIRRHDQGSILRHDPLREMG